jgi:hypothetical protein
MAKPRRAARTAALAVVLLVSAACSIPTWIAGCSLKERVNEPTGSQRESLTSSVTITLSAPNSLSPLTPVLLESNSIFVGSGVNIVSGTAVAMGSAGGGFHAEPDGLLNDVWSRGPADLRDRVHVRGTLHASSATLGNSVVISARDTTPTFDPASTLSWTVTYPSGTGANIIVNSGQSQQLPPGLYGSIILNSQSTLNLSSGTYFLTDFVVNSQVTVNLNQANGPVVIYVTNALNLRGTFAPGAASDGGVAHPDLLIGYLGTNQITVESLFDGAIVAPFTTVILRAVNGVHSGYFAAKDFQILDAHAQVQYRLPTALIAASTPNVVCVNNKGSGRLEALFGYNNASKALVHVPVGPTNQMSPGAAGQGQPEDFLPINVPSAFAVLFSGSALTWSLAGGSAIASALSPACPTTACASCREGELCVGGHCVTECGDGLCAGDESCNTCPTDCACVAGQVCVRNSCATPAACGVDWQCGAGNSFGVAVDCGACSAGGTCNNHVCR